MLKVFIMEDNLRLLSYYKGIVNLISNKLHLTGTQVTLCSSTSQLCAALPVASPNNIFILDIEINGNSRAGLQMSLQIRRHDHQAKIIFITTHDELLYTTCKYRVSALDFIAKDRGNVLQELSTDFKAIIKESSKASSTPLFTYKSYNHVSTIPINRICYFTSNQTNSHASTMVTADHQTIQIHQHLHEIEQANPYFFRAHRRFLVNPCQVCKVDFYYHRAEFYTGLSCPLSRRHAHKLLALTKVYA